MIFSMTTKTTPFGMSSRKMLVRPAGKRKNSPIAKSTANSTVPAQAPRPMSSRSPCSLSGAWALAEIPRALKPMLSDSASATTPRTTGRRSRRWRLVRETSGSDWTSISPRPSSLGLRTATAQVEMPRIITPSSTAWPPMGASWRACFSPTLTPPIVSAPSRVAVRLLMAELGAGELAGVVGLRALGDQPPGVGHGGQAVLAGRPPEDEHPLLARGQGCHGLGVDLRPVHGQAHGHVLGASVAHV